MGAQRIFIDGISLLRTVPSTLPNGGNGNGHRGPLPPALAAVAGRAAARGPDGAPVARGHRHRAAGLRPGDHAEYLTDTVIVLRREPHRRGSHRSLEITKSRGQDYDTGRHTLRITAGTGLEVFRRVQTPPHDLSRAQPTSSTRQSVIGSGPLDALFGGGVFDGSVTMVVGISGVGQDGARDAAAPGRGGEPEARPDGLPRRAPRTGHA